jgi:hypothetical protein
LITKSATGTVYGGRIPFSLNVKLLFMALSTHSSIVGLNSSVKATSYALDGSSAEYALLGLTIRSATGLTLSVNLPYSLLVRLLFMALSTYSSIVGLNSSVNAIS